MDMFVGGVSEGGRERRLRGAVGTVVERGWRWSWTLTRRARGPVGGALPDIQQPPPTTTLALPSHTIIYKYHNTFIKSSFLQLSFISWSVGHCG